MTSVFSAMSSNFTWLITSTSSDDANYEDEDAASIPPRGMPPRRTAVRDAHVAPI